MNPLRRLFLPFQIVLLNRRMCPGCTRSLDTQGVRDEFREGKAIISCACKRKYILDLNTQQYRRATKEEEREYIERRKI